MFIAEIDLYEYHVDIYVISLYSINVTVVYYGHLYTGKVSNDL